MAIAVRSSSSASNNGATTVVVTKPSGVANNDLLLAFSCTDLDGNATNLTAPAGWTLTGTAENTTGGVRGKVFWKVANAEGASYTFGCLGTSDNLVEIVAFTGVDPAAPIAVAASGAHDVTGTSAAVAANSVTGTIDYALVTCHGSQTAGTFTTPGGMSEIIDTNTTNTAAAIDWQLLTSSGATGTKTATHSVSEVWISYALVLRAAGVIYEDVTTPAIATGTGTSVLTTASFSPPANSLLVVMVGGGWSNLANVTATVSDSTSGTWTTGPSENGDGQGGIAKIAYRYLSTAPGSMTVSATYANLGGGRYLAVRVLNGCASSQAGAASAHQFMDPSTTTWTQSLTTTTTNAVVYGVMNDNGAADTVTASTNSTLLSWFNDSTDAVSLASLVSTSPVSTPGATTYGFTTSVARGGGMALLEILPTGAAPTTPSTQAMVNDTSLAVQAKRPKLTRVRISPQILWSNVSDSDTATGTETPDPTIAFTGAETGTAVDAESVVITDFLELLTVRQAAMRRAARVPEANVTMDFGLLILQKTDAETATGLDTATVGVSDGDTGKTKSRFS